MEFDYSKLRGRIVEKYRTITAFAEELGIAVQTISAKLNGEIGITKTETLTWCELLDISIEELGVYFFTKKVYNSKLSNGEV